MVARQKGRKQSILTPWPAKTPENHAGFSAIIGARFSSEGVNAVEAAYEISKSGHRTQTRKGGERYFNHPRAVAIILLVELMVEDWRAVVVGLLHDIREDTCLLSPWAIEKLFGVEVLRDLQLLTKIPKEGYLARLQLFGGNMTMLVKLADRLHNVRTLGSCPLEHIVKQLRETREHYLPLANLLIDRLPPNEKWRGEYLRREIEKACAYWETGRQVQP